MCAMRRKSRHKKKKQLSSNQGKSIPREQRININAPAHITLCDKKSVTGLIECIRKIDECVKNKHPVKLNLTNTSSISAEGMILLYAESERIISQSEIPKPISTKSPKDQKSNEILQQIEFYDLINEVRDIKPCRHDVISWRLLKGNDQSGDALADLEKLNVDEAKVRAIWRGVTEAVNNSVEHAYISPRKYDGFQGGKNRWWMFSHIRKDKVDFVVCDLGCGYRNTIQTTIGSASVNQLISTLPPYKMDRGITDAHAIAIAIEYGKSSTKQSERGKGSKDALSIIENTVAGKLRIYSNKGFVSCEHKTGGLSTKPGRLSHCINGTVIWWSLPLNGDA